MLKENTIKREMRKLRKIINEDKQHDAVTASIKDQAYGMESALLWVLGGCTWTPSGLVDEL